MKKLEIRYGLLSGLANISLSIFNWYLIAQPFGYSASETFGYLSIVVALMFIPIGIKYYKEKLNDQMISFFEAFKIGIGIALISSIITFFYSTVYFMVLGDEFIEWSQKGLSASELAAVQNQLESLPDFVLSPWFQGLLMFVTVFLIGLVITLISAMILKSKKSINAG